MRRKPTLKAYKYRIYPSHAQVVFFAKTFGCCRLVWNKMLDKKLQAYKKKERIQQDTPAKYKDEFPFLKEVDSFALCNVQLQLEKAFKDHFRNRKQFKVPKFKKKRDKQSYTTNNTHNSIRVDFDKSLLYQPKIKEGVKIELHRRICHCCGHKNEDLVLHDRTWCCPACGEAHDRDVNASINLYFVGLGRPEVTPVEQALVDDRSPHGIPKKPSRVETGNSTEKC